MKESVRNVFDYVLRKITLLEGRYLQARRAQSFHRSQAASSAPRPKRTSLRTPRRSRRQRPRCTAPKTPSLERGSVGSLMKSTSFLAKCELNVGQFCHEIKFTQHQNALDFFTKILTVFGKMLPQCLVKSSTF